MHGIQIISRASLCCCMEGMGVFELDLLDNIRSTQISFHASLFHADRAVHTGMLIRLLLFLRKFEWTNLKLTNFSVSLLNISFISFPYNKWWMNIYSFLLYRPPGLLCLLFSETLYWKRNLKSRLLQTDSSLLLLLFMTWLAGRRSDLTFCFDFLRLLICEWVGCNPATDVMSRDETSRYMVRGYQARSVTRDPPWHQLLHLSSWLLI